MSAPVIDLRNASKTYRAGSVAVHALRRVSLAVHRGDYVAIMGSSGSGKSTLMNLLGCLDAPSAGRYLLDGIDVAGVEDRELAGVRNRTIGFVFQSFNLIPRTSALHNVELPLVYARVPPRQRRERAVEALTAVGLADRMTHLPSELSGGQQQRVAIARAIVADPALILADEPTGNLDSAASGEVLAIFDRLNTAGRTVVVITHETDVAAHTKRRVLLHDGRIVSDERHAPLDDAAPRYAAAGEHHVQRAVG